MMLVTLTCYLCGVEFGMVKHHYEKRQEDGKEFYCTNGHGQHFMETEATKLKKRLFEEEQRRIRAENARDIAQKREAKATKRLTRIEKRIAQGICPCCDRRFADLAQHVAEMHPEFAENNPTIMSRFRGLLTEQGTHPEGQKK